MFKTDIGTEDLEKFKKRGMVFNATFNNISFKKREQRISDNVVN